MTPTLAHRLRLRRGRTPIEKIEQDTLGILARSAERVGVRQQIVKLGDTRGDLVAIESGIKEGEQVVTAGGFKLRNAEEVQVNNTVQPTSSATPKPDNN